VRELIDSRYPKTRVRAVCKWRPGAKWRGAQSEQRRSKTQTWKWRYIRWGHREERKQRKPRKAYKSKGIGKAKATRLSSAVAHTIAPSDSQSGLPTLSLLPSFFLSFFLSFIYPFFSNFICEPKRWHLLKIGRTWLISIHRQIGSSSIRFSSSSLLFDLFSSVVSLFSFGSNCFDFGFFLFFFFFFFWWMVLCVCVLRPNLGGRV